MGHRDRATRGTGLELVRWNVFKLEVLLDPVGSCGMRQLLGQTLVAKYGARFCLSSHGGQVPGTPAYRRQGEINRWGPQSASPLQASDTTVYQAGRERGLGQEGSQSSWGMRWGWGPWECECGVGVRCGRMGWGTEGGEGNLL